MKASHPEDFRKYGCDIESIIANPDYVGKNVKDDSVEFTKEYILNSNQVKDFIAKGTLKKLDK